MNSEKLVVKDNMRFFVMNGKWQFFVLALLFTFHYSLFVPVSAQQRKAATTQKKVQKKTTSPQKKTTTKKKGTVQQKKKPVTVNSLKAEQKKVQQNIKEQELTSRM